MNPIDMTFWLVITVCGIIGAVILGSIITGCVLAWKIIKRIIKEEEE